MIVVAQGERFARRVASQRADHVHLELNHFLTSSASPILSVQDPTSPLFTMTRGSRVAAWSAFFTALYLLAFFAYVPVPFVEEKTAGEILPAVSTVNVSKYESGIDHAIGSVVATCIIWLICALLDGTRAVHLPRCGRGVHRTTWRTFYSITTRIPSLHPPRKYPKPRKICASRVFL